MTRLPLPPRAEYGDDDQETYIKHCQAVYRKQANRDRLWFAGVVLGIFALTGGAMYGLIMVADWIAASAIAH
jgi:hypothetical protein